MIEVAIFDCDGIYVDSDRLQVEAEQQTAQTIAEELGVELDFDAIDWSTFQGWGRTKIATELFGPDEVLGEKYREAVVETSVAIASHDNLNLIHEISDFTDYLALHGCRLGLATSSNRRIYDKYCELFPIDCFQTTVAHRESLDDKPKPGPFKEVMRRLNVAPEKTVIIEDSPSGITAGRYSGGLVVAHATTQPVESLRSSTDAHLVAESYRQAAYQLQPHLF